MQPVQHRTSTQVIGAPPNWNQEVLPCSALAVRVDDVCISSHWKPSETELEILSKGGFIVLTVFGHIHPVVSLSVET